MTKSMELTVTQKLRLFLARSGQPVAPWSSVEEVMDRLYGLLYERREQDGLWLDLAALLDSIQAETSWLLASPDAEILSRSRVATLVAELGRAVRASAVAPRAGAMRRFAVGKSAGVAACIALLAASFSLGCGSSNSSTDKTPDAAVPTADTSRPSDTATSPPQDTAPKPPVDTAPVQSPDVNVKTDSPPQDTTPKPPLDTAPVQSPDVNVKTDSPPSDASVADTHDASTSPDATGGDAVDSTGDALVDLFRDSSPADIAAKLEASVDMKIDTPIMMPAYKGVTFPPEQNA
jgi:outer membrane biosynthesis protein TonB